jgi:hypothetical protein
MAIVVMLEHGLEQVGYVTASAIWRVRSKPGSTGLFSVGMEEPWPVFGYSELVIEMEIGHAMLNLPSCF